MSAGSFVWPLGKSFSPDEMNTSYGPRIDENEWDFHDGIDLPAPVGTAVHAVADAVVHRAGPADRTGPGRGFRSTHIVLRVVDPTDGNDDLFIVYLHLDGIEKGVIPGETVGRGDVLGAVGQEDATYPHLHFEFRKGDTLERHSRHPLRYLPYVNTPNLGAPTLDRCNFSGANGSLRTIRARFAVPHRSEGDVRRIDIQLRRLDGSNPRDILVNFDKRSTILSSQGDDNAFKNDIAVEGYQKSNLKGDNRIDLDYGVLLRNVGPEFSAARVRVRDARGAQSASTEFALPALANGDSAVNSRVTFEDPAFPPPGWVVRAKSGNTCRRNATGDGQHGLVCEELVDSQSGLVGAALRFALPGDRAVTPMSWRLGAVLRKVNMPTAAGTVIYPFALVCGSDLVAAASLRRIHSGSLIAGVLIRDDSGFFRERLAVRDGVFAPNLKWELQLLRIGTRETTAVLWLNDTRVAQINGDTVDIEPDRAYAGILHRHNAIAVTLHLDDLVVTEVPRD